MIIEHPTYMYDTKYSYPFHEEHCMVVVCDFCGKMASRAGNGMGEAADRARAEGFSLVKGSKLSDPMKWSCGCNKNK